ncbi:hypothetical protein B1R32_102209 [Abditibacterium utsteinense]|uniref:DUF6984 domain-containing protein n=1 Tax=Abditibacterium utsteinense TaxID=1960156 RepID=A0A2S8SWM9_9BACT|nr:hypothetical protein [Abditibacterium utsteinense]PQV65200.1 hypothetical protein B1R32_102209 [Abditibacterium utsteinense]
MLDKFPFQSAQKSRRLREVEKVLLVTMLSFVPNSMTETLDTLLVEDLNDGGMGSIQFLSSGEKQRFGKELVEALYIDEDGILVIITVYLDKQDKLYEIDFWKVDFSPLLRYPTPDQIHKK